MKLFIAMATLLVLIIPALATNDYKPTKKEECYAGLPPHASREIAEQLCGPRE
jgi:hypothetical protein